MNFILKFAIKTLVFGVVIVNTGQTPFEELNRQEFSGSSNDFVVD